MIYVWFNKYLFYYSWFEKGKASSEGLNSIKIWLKICHKLTISSFGMIFLIRIEENTSFLWNVYNCGKCVERGLLDATTEDLGLFNIFSSNLIKTSKAPVYILCWSIKLFLTSICPIVFGRPIYIRTDWRVGLRGNACYSDWRVGRKLRMFEISIPPLIETHKIILF